MKRAESALGAFIVVLGGMALLVLLLWALALLSGVVPHALTTPGPTFHVVTGQYDCTLVHADGKWLWPPICSPTGGTTKP